MSRQGNTVSVPSERFLARREALLAALRTAVDDAAASLLRARR